MIEQLLSGVLDEYFFCTGSPCVELVTWVLPTTAVKASYDQIEHYNQRYVEDLGAYKELSAEVHKEQCMITAISDKNRPA